MSTNSLLTDPESIRSNQNGQITKEQLRALKDKLSDLPGGLTIGVMAALFALTVLLAGKTLSRSTPLAVIALVGIILAAFAITSFLGGILASLRMTHISVEQVHGQVTWNNNRYTAVSNGRTLEPITTTLSILPGDYTFYLKRGSNYLLSAQLASSPAGAGGSAPTAPMDLHALKALLDKPLDFNPQLEPERAAQHVAQLTQALQSMQGFDTTGITQQDVLDIKNRLIEQTKQIVHGQSFKNLVEIGQEATRISQPALDSQGVKQVSSALERVGMRHAATLDTNQAGKVSASQRRGLIKEVSSNLAWSAFFGIIWTLLSVYLAMHAKWTGVLAVFGMFLLVLAMLASNVRNEIRDLVSGSVELQEGWVTKKTRSVQGRNGSRTYYYYQLNGNNYTVSQHAYEALIEGDYKVYLLPNTRTIVNLDPVAASSPSSSPNT